jgi:hypothetical protein
VQTLSFVGWLNQCGLPSDLRYRHEHCATRDEEPFRSQYPSFLKNTNLLVHKREIKWTGLTASDNDDETSQVLNVFGCELGLLLTIVEM